MGESPQDRLGRLASQMAGFRLADAFRADPGRARAMVAEHDGILLDYSKNLVTPEVMDALVDLAAEAEVHHRAAAMFAGERINVSENRPVLHVALRAPREASIVVDGVDVVAEVHQVLDRMSVFADAIRSGRWLGHTGRPILNVVNVGIGGSDLGPAMAYNALRPYSRAGMTFRFVSNVDGADLESALLGLDPAETLFIVCSKSWHTKETLTNATAARRWLLAGLSGDVKAVARHFVAVSTDERGVSKFGIDTANMFPIWDWVGGRYSVDSAIGLSLMIAIGPDQFREFLAGFRAIDEHFLSAHPRENLPMLMGLLGVWYSRFLGIDTVAVLPYAHYLSLLPAYLQQLEMESNGKRVTLEGGPVVGGTGSIIWGQAGTNGQHAFYQLLHQGTRTVPAEFIGFARPMSGLTDQHDLLMSNLIAQSEALAFGRDEAVLAAAGVAAREIPHRVCPGNRPSTVLLLRGLTPYGLGQLIALYEHRVFTEGVIYGIDSFDQWGVELGKILADGVMADILSGDDARAYGHDPSTNALISWFKAHRASYAEPSG